MGAKRLGLMAWVLGLVLIAVQGAFAAQSTADAVADDKLKEQLRGEVVGATVFPGEEKEYVIGIGDVLGVSIYGEGDMAATASTGAAKPDGEGKQSASGIVVRMDGRISLLHVGDVNVLGMTLTQLADYLKKLFATAYSDPIVTAVLIQSNSRRYTVMGQVAKPGVFALDFPITVVQAVARGGGFNEWASHDLTVVRAGDGVKTSAGKGGENTIKIDYDDIVKSGKLDKNIYIQSGDIIIVH